MAPPCEKRVFRTFVLAKKVAKRIRRTQGGAPMVPYRCKQCGCWHLGHELIPGKAPNRRRFV